MAALVVPVVLLACGPTSQPPVIHVVPVSMSLTDSSSAFGLALLDNLLAEKDAGNVFISPLSATIMLSMAASAAQGETKAAILKMLGVDPTANADEQAKETIQRLAQSDPNTQLELAQAVWVQNGLKLDPGYQQRLHDYYQAQLANLDFASPSAPGVVNRWVDGATHGRITKLFDRFDPSWVGLLANATYFHALWATEFKPMTASVPFHDFGGGTSTPPMMTRDDGTYSFYAHGYVSVLLPYKGGRFSALVILPKAQLSASDFGGFLTASVWSDTLNAFHKALGATLNGKCAEWGAGDTGVTCDGGLQMPKFTLEYYKDLTANLTAIGMPADASLPAWCSDCFLSTVVQRTYLQVDEKGTTAAAVTGGAVATSAHIPVVVDHPFAFALLDNASGAPLFTGVIGDLN